jgi:hypothetical protein
MVGLKHLPCAALLVALVGCATDAADGDDTAGGGGKADGETCADATYGDGTCQLDLECGIPDIDCFKTFPSDAEAGQWLTGVWGTPQIAADDPRFVRARALLDRAWATYQAEAPIGKLAEARLALVLLDDPTANAWVTGDPDMGQAALSVQVHTGIFLEGFTDEDLLGVLYHEIAHITKLHVFPEIKDRTKRFYLASGAEPVGAFQPENERVRDAATRWLELAQFSGVYSTPALDDLPLGGNLDSLFALYLQHVTATSVACTPATNAVNALYTQLQSSPIDGSLTIDTAGTAEIDRVLDVLGACVAPQALTMQAFLTAQGTEWETYVMDQIPTDEKWLLAEDAFEVITLLANDRRGKLAAIESQVAKDLGQPWSAVRYFSTEEQADDISVTMTQAAKLADPGVSGFMLDAMGEARAECEQHIVAGTTPYGIDLEDDHHGTCWRVAHARQLVLPAGTAARRIAGPDESPRTPFVPTRMPDGKPMY